MCTSGTSFFDHTRSNSWDVLIVASEIMRPVVCHWRFGYVVFYFVLHSNHIFCDTEVDWLDIIGILVLYIPE